MVLSFLKIKNILIFFYFFYLLFKYKYICETIKLLSFILVICFLLLMINFLYILYVYIVNVVTNLIYNSSYKYEIN